jgi:ATP-dependent DNA helicase RecG
MNKLKIFISSVQSEFASERQMLYDYLSTDALLGRFFEPFIFEILPAKDISVFSAYLGQVDRCEIFIGIFGLEYGSENTDGISPTEMEFNYASQLHKTRLIFILNQSEHLRHSKEKQLIKKAEHVVVRKKFNDAFELKTAVYVALVNLLEERELIRTGPFDASVCKDASLDDIDPERIRWFVHSAQRKRGFPLSPDETHEKILTHLNLLKMGNPTNAAILLFGKQPQRFFITSEIRCAMFYGYEVEKPIPSYQVYKGDIFQLVDQAVDFVMSRIDLAVGDRSRSVDVPTQYEIPRTAVTEAIVNAVAHRDYTSNGSVQVMLFRNRLEVWNPGQLPFQLTIEKLKEAHGSFPANPLLTEPMYLAGYIERIGTGIPDMIKACRQAGLKEPKFAQNETFTSTIWRKEQATEQATEQVPPQATPQATPQVKNLVLILDDEMTRDELQEKLQLKDRENFRKLYMVEAMEGGFIEMTIPDKPTSPEQKYRLTGKGKQIQKQLKENK